MKRTTLFAAALAAAQAANAQDAATDLAWKSRLIAEGHGLRGDSIFAPGLALTDFGRDRARFEEEARGRLGPVSLLLTGTVSGEERRTATTTLLANEAYVDFRSGANHFTVGKKILSGDVGYGFRPIDVIQREVRLQVLPPVLEGVPNLAWERFTEESAWSVILAHPGRGQRADPKQDGSLTLRHYRRSGKADLHAVARASHRYGFETGAAISAVPNESLELHASFLVQRRGERLAPLAEPAAPAALLDPTRAVGTSAVDWPRKALAGFTWTWDNGWSVIGETWWDGTAPGAADWQALAAQAQRRNALLGFPGVPPAAVGGSIAASMRLFQAPSLSRRSALVHLGWTDPAGGGWTAALDVVRTLEDGGWTATAAAGWEADRWRIDAGIRRFGGRPDSAYRLLPERGILFAGVSLAF